MSQVENNKNQYTCNSVGAFTAPASSTRKGPLVAAHILSSKAGERDRTCARMPLMA